MFALHLPKLTMLVRHLPKLRNEAASQNFALH